MIPLVYLAKSLARTLGIDVRAAYHRLSARSLKSALREQDLEGLAEELRRVVPDLADQYTRGFDDDEYARYWELKMRGLHAFQVRAALDALESMGGSNLVLADLGDSSGNHAAYLRALAPAGKISEIVSVNLDPVAVDKIRAKGGRAILGRVETLDPGDIRPDLYLSFQTIEHLTDPVRFLHGLAVGGHGEYLLMTVPFRRTSRFGGVHLRLPEDAMPERLTAEDVHIHEFNPEDWRLLAYFAGFSTVFSRIYWQYPKSSPLRLLAPLWKALDFEGFLALFLRRDLRLAERYTDW